jgi:hypothetical protein
MAKKPGVMYSPPPITEDFIQDYIPGELFFSFIVGPFGSGKTTGALMKIAFMASLQEPNSDGIRKTRCVVVRNTFPQLRDTTISSWNYWFKDGEAGKWFATKNTFLLKFADVECEVMFRALDSAADIARVLSLETTFAVLDEFVQIQPEIVEALSGRCGRYPPTFEGGATNFGMWGASNPGEEDTWWFEHLLEKTPSNVAYFHQPSGLSENPENFENLPKNYYKNLAKGKSWAWIKQFIEAEWGYSLAGRPVVPTFSREIHVSSKPIHADPYLPLIIGYDPGMHCALIFGQEDLFGRLFVVDELVLEGYGAKRMIEDQLIPLIKRKYSEFEIIISPDPSVNGRTQTDETTVRQVLKNKKYAKFFTVYTDGQNTRNLLQPRLDAIDNFTTRLTERGPALLIDPRCKKIIRALVSGWRFEKTQKGEEKAKPEKNGSSHPGDAFGYLCRYYVSHTAKHGSRMSPKTFRPPTFNNAYV